MQWVFAARRRAKRPARRTRRDRREVNIAFTNDDTLAKRLWKERKFLVMGTILVISGQVVWGWKRSGGAAGGTRPGRKGRWT